MISLGIYDGAGKLVRVLQREAELDDFSVGNDALSATWDGKNDACEPLPPGKYHARGYVVGDGDVEGVGFFFNDWVTDESSLRIARVSSIAFANGMPMLTVKIVPDRTLTLACNLDATIETTGEEPLPHSPCHLDPEPPLLLEPVACDDGKDKTRWVIDRLASGSPETEVKQISASKELLRRMAIAPNDPQPRQIAASKDTDTIFLLEESDTMQRVRSLTLQGKAGEADRSDWKIDFAKKIVPHKNFTIENGKPVVSSGGKAPVEKIAVKLAPNPLKNDAREKIELLVGYDADGSFLKTADGLPLQSISDTHNLIRIVMSPRSENAVDIFQDDGAVVEEFRVDQLDQIMSFDCGEIELK